MNAGVLTIIDADRGGIISASLARQGLGLIVRARRLGNDGILPFKNLPGLLPSGRPAGFVHGVFYGEKQLVQPPKGTGVFGKIRP